MTAEYGVQAIQYFPHSLLSFTNVFFLGFSTSQREKHQQRGTTTHRPLTSNFTVSPSRPSPTTSSDTNVTVSCRPYASPTTSSETTITFPTSPISRPHASEEQREKHQPGLQHHPQSVAHSQGLSAAREMSEERNLTFLSLLVLLSWYHPYHPHLDHHPPSRQRGTARETLASQLLALVS